MWNSHSIHYHSMSEGNKMNKFKFFIFKRFSRIIKRFAMKEFRSLFVDFSLPKAFLIHSILLLPSSILSPSSSSFEFQIFPSFLFCPAYRASFTVASTLIHCRCCCCCRLTEHWNLNEYITQPSLCHCCFCCLFVRLQQQHLVNFPIEAASSGVEIKSEDEKKAHTR